jgi:long-subunit acyl-CoA synthetase (AMP-forming)
VKEDRTIDSLFRYCVERYPGRGFLSSVRRDGGAIHIERTTFAAAGARVAATVLRLESLGLGTGDHALVYTDDIADSIFFLLACFHLGLVPVPIAPLFSVEYAARVADRVSARAYFALPEGAARLCQRGLCTLCFADTPSDAPPGVERLPARADLPMTRALDVLRAAGTSHGELDPLIITPTSGSTGEPKLPIWSHRSMERAAYHLGVAFGWAEDPAERALVVNAPTHGLGLALMSSALLVAAESCVPSRVDVHTLLDEVRAIDFTCSFMTPRVMKSLHQQFLDEASGRATGRFLGPSARVVAFSGAPVPVELCPFLVEQGIEPVDVWGASETGIIACSERGRWQEGWLRPCPGIEVRLTADRELSLRAPHFFLGYHGDPELTHAAHDADRYYLSGDAGEIDADGRVRLTGRTRDVFNTFEGSNIYPARIESMIEALGWVSQAVMIGDRLPYCCALIVPWEVGDGAVTDADIIDPDGNAALYERARADLAVVNAKLEQIERVRRFWLLVRPFANELYERVGLLRKTRRNRAAIGHAFAARIQQLYEPSFPEIACVPPS